MHVQRWWSVAIVALLAACGGSSTPAVPRLTALPFASTHLNSAYVVTGTPDGSVVGGGSLVDSGETAPVVWRGSQIAVLPYMGPALEGFQRHDTVTHVTSSGVLLGNEGISDMNPLPYLFDENGTWVPVVAPDTFVRVFSATGVSDDGNFVVGFISNGTVQHGGYRIDRGAQRISICSSTFTVTASDCGQDSVFCDTAFLGVTGDGMTAVGIDTYWNGPTHQSLRIPIAYTFGSGSPPVRLGLPDGYESGEAQAIARNGRGIIGQANGPFRSTIAVYWDEHFVLHEIGSLGVDVDTGSGTSTLALGISADGTRVVGTSNGTAWIWTEATGIVALADWLASAGLSVGDWEFNTAATLSDDGHWISGTGRNGAYQQAYTVWVP